MAFSYCIIYYLEILHAKLLLMAMEFIRGVLSFYLKAYSLKWHAFRFGKHIGLAIDFVHIIVVFVIRRATMFFIPPVTCINRYRKL